MRGPCLKNKAEIEEDEDTPTYTHMRTHMYTHMYIHVHTNTCMYSYINTYIYHTKN